MRRGENGNTQGNLSEQRREQTNSTHIWHQGQGSKNIWTLNFSLSRALPRLPKFSNSLIIHEPKDGSHASHACFNDLTQTVFNSLNVHLHLVYNVGPQNHIEEKNQKFKTSRINKSPSYSSFNTGSVEFEKPTGAYFFISVCEK